MVRREYPEGPIPGVGAVVLRRGAQALEVLLVKRAREPLAGSWSLPGGVIELGETASDACVREVLEETGIQVHVIRAVETFDIILRNADGRIQFHYIIVDMLCEPMGGVLLAGEDAADTAWASVAEVLEQGLFSLTHRACTVITKAVEMSCGAGFLGEQR